MTTEDVSVLKNNCAEFSSRKNAVAVLRQADGKKHYTEIAKVLSMHPTAVSGLLKKAEKLGLARKKSLGIYKKVSGILGYIPNKAKASSGHKGSVSSLISKISSRNKSRKSADIAGGLSISRGIIDGTKKMATAYEYLFAVENTLRELIRSVLGISLNWWKLSVPEGIRTEVEKNIQNAPYHAVKRKDELEYTHLGQLKEIIVNRKNWSAFLPHLNTKDKEDFSATINKAIPSRNAVGHCIPLNSKDQKVVGVRFEDILKMLK